MITAGDLSPNGQIVTLAINGGSDLIIVDTSCHKSTNDFSQTLTGFQSGKTILSLNWLPNTSRLVSSGTDFLAKLYDLRSNKCTLSLKGHSNAISSAAISVNEHWLATASWDKSIGLWSLSSGIYRSEGPSSFTKGHTSSVSCVAMTSDCELHLYFPF